MPAPQRIIVARWHLVARFSQIVIIKLLFVLKPNRKAALHKCNVHQFVCLCSFVVSVA